MSLDGSRVVVEIVIMCDSDLWRVNIKMWGIMAGNSPLFTCGFVFRIQIKDQNIYIQELDINTNYDMNMWVIYSVR